jgi:hypothetical protein
MILMGIMTVGLDIKHQLMVIFLWKCNKAHQLFIDFKKAYDSVRREVLYNIFIEFGVGSHDNS